jgi:hypothetical protein
MSMTSMGPPKRGWNTAAVAAEVVQSSVSGGTSSEILRRLLVLCLTLLFQPAGLARVDECELRCGRCGRG